MLKYITFNTGSELICFLASLLLLNGRINKIWKLFIPYLFLTCIVELTGIYLKGLHHPNQWPYNILLVLQILITSVFYKYLLNIYKSGKYLVIWGGVIVLYICYCIEIIEHTFFIFNDVTYTVMNVLFVIYSLYFFYLLINDGKYIKLKFSAEFWWAVGAVFFYFGSTAVNLFRGKLHRLIIFGHNHSVTYYLYIILNVILYACWTYSFICKRWLTTTSGT
jgi:hypothetical protein